MQRRSRTQQYALFFIDVNGVIRTWNAGFHRLFGYSASEWIGRAASIIFTPAEKAVDLCNTELNTAREKGSSSDIRWHRKKDGTEIFANCVLEAFKHQSGNLLGFTKIISDETERDHLQDSLIKSNQGLEDFAYAASHDLHEPLRSVRSFAQIVLTKQRDRLSDDGREHLGYIVKAVPRMSHHGPARVCKGGS